jgi:DNA-binding NarL/FixJ family response regulator
MSVDRLGPPARNRGARDTLRVPPGLRALTFHLGSEEFALLSFDLCGDPGHTARINSLSPSQRHVAQLAVEGRTNAEIASARSTSVRTIENQIAEVYRKLGVRSRRGLAALGLPRARGLADG